VFSPESVSAFTNVLPLAYRYHFEGFSDERSKAELVAKALGIKNHYAVETTPDSLIVMLEKSLCTIGQPANAAFSLLQSGIYHAAATHEIDILFSGFGGDEVVSQHVNGRYIESLISRRRYFELFNYFRRIEGSYLNSLGRVAFQALKSVVRQQFLSLNSEQKIIEDVLLKQDVVRKAYTVAENYTGSVLSKEPLKERALFHINRSSISKRIETGYFMTNEFDLNYRYPLLDVKLIDYYYQLPDQWKVDHKLGRSIFRKALKGILPPDIVEQSKRNNFHTTATPFARVECAKNFEPLKDWLLCLSTEHRIFDYVDRVQLEQLKYQPDAVGYFEMKRIYNQLKTITQLAMFFDKRANMKLYDI
jgi:asparagine synthase (glutamine-hydrolysing)